MPGFCKEKALADQLLFLPAVTACPVSCILDGLGCFKEVALAGPSTFVRPRSLLFQQAGEQKQVLRCWHNRSAAAVLQSVLEPAFAAAVQYVKLGAVYAGPLGGRSDVQARRGSVAVDHLLESPCLNGVARWGLTLGWRKGLACFPG